MAWLPFFHEPLPTYVWEAAWFSAPAAIVRSDDRIASMPLRLTPPRPSRVRIPGGSFLMASTAEEMIEALALCKKEVLGARCDEFAVQFRAEGLAHKVTLSSYEMDRTEVSALGDGFYRVVVRYGFMEETDVPGALKRLDNICGGPFEIMQTSFFLSRQTLLPSEHPGMALWREKLFAWMMRNAATPMEFFRLPTNRVVELGSQVEI